MKHDPDKHHRRSIRLKGYDYSDAGAYFVIICTQNRECLFGDIVDEELRLNNAGTMIHKTWHDLSVKYSDIETDEYVVMPNHVHGIIIIVGAGPCACPGILQGVTPTGLSLPDVVHRFKPFATAEYRNGVKQKNWPPFNGRLWQRNYYEHIIRGEEEINHIREYIINNPLKSENDENNLGNIQ